MKLADVIAVKPLPNYCLYLTFEDGVLGVVDLKRCIQFTGVFAPLQDPDYFAQVKVVPELGTVYWESGADLDPVVLYQMVKQS